MVPKLTSACKGPSLKKDRFFLLALERDRLCAQLSASRSIIYFLLTKRQGRTGRILPEVFLAMTERKEVRTRKTEGNFPPVPS